MIRIIKDTAALLLFSAVILSQTVDSVLTNSTMKDSVNRSAESSIKLSINPFVSQEFNYFLNQNLRYQNYFNDYQFDPYQRSSESGNEKLSKSELIKIRESMNKSFAVFREGELKRDLGVFGQVLGYGQAAAVVGLAIYHISKYGFK